MVKPTLSSETQCYEGRGGITGRPCNFYPNCVCGDRDALRSASGTDLELLRKVSESWVNGRKVIDGIPKALADQVRARFRWETQHVK